MGRRSVLIGILTIALGVALLLVNARVPTVESPPDTTRHAKHESAPPGDPDDTPVRNHFATDEVLPPTVLGEVVDSVTGEPVPAFRIGVSTAGRRGLQTHSFDHGAGVFEVLETPTGDVRLVFAAEGYSERTETLRGIAPGEVVTGLRIGMAPVTDVSGRVIGPEGEGVARARIFVNEIPPVALYAVRTVAVTDAAGKFLLSDVSVRTSILAAAHPDYTPGSVVIQLRHFETGSAEIRLGEAVSLAGRVTRGGEPVYFQTIRLEYPGEGAAVFAEQTDEQGRYRFEGLPQGPVTLFVATPHLGDVPARTIRHDTELVQHADNRVDFELAIDAVLAGRVHSGDLYVPREAGIHAVVEEPNGHRSRFYGELDHDGSFRFPLLPSGVATVGFHFGTYYNQTLYEVDTALTANRSTWLDIYPETRAELELRFTDIPGQADSLRFNLEHDPPPSDPMANRHVWSGQISQSEHVTDGERGQWPDRVTISARLQEPGNYVLNLHATMLRSPDNTLVATPSLSPVAISIHSGESNVLDFRVHENLRAAEAASAQTVDRDTGAIRVAPPPSREH